MILLKEKIIRRLDELMASGSQIKESMAIQNDEEYEMWEMQCTKLLERIGGETLVDQYASAGLCAHGPIMSDEQALEFKKRRVSGRINYLKVLKDDLILFGDEDEPELKKIKHKFEGAEFFSEFDLKPVA